MYIHNILYISLLGLFTFSSCDSFINKNELWEFDYRLFRDTPAWKLAEAANDGDTLEMGSILKSNPSLIDYQEPTYGRTLLMMCILNQRRVTFPFSIISNTGFDGPFNKGQKNVFDFLLKHGASVNIVSKIDGVTAMLLACFSDSYNIDFVRALLQSGADVNYVQPFYNSFHENDNRTALLNAVKCNKMELVKLLVEHGADINFINAYNKSPLSESISSDGLDITMYLLYHGADYKLPVSTIGENEIENSEDTTKITLVEQLRYFTFPINSDSYNKKKKIIAFLKQGGIDYKQTKIPNCIIEYAKREYPKTWHEYLMKY